MVARGYATAADVAAYLGQVFSPDQDAQADALLEAAENQVDAYTGRTWLAGSVTEDHYGLTGPLLWLRGAPALAITSILRRSALDDTSPYTLVAGTDYEVEDAASGRLRVPAWGDYDRFRITYTTPATVPADVALATRMLVAHWMRPTIEGIAPGVQSYSISGDVSVTYQTGIGQDGIPAEVKAILKSRRRGLVFA